MVLTVPPMAPLIKFFGSFFWPPLHEILSRGSIAEFIFGEDPFGRLPVFDVEAALKTSADESSVLEFLEGSLGGACADIEASAGVTDRKEEVAVVGSVITKFQLDQQGAGGK